MKIAYNEKVKSKSIKIAYSGLLIALGILLPQVFHVFGQNAGMTFLPIQIPILLAGVLLGGFYGGTVGLLVPILSCVLTGMPPVPKVYFMIFELVIYGVAGGILIRKTNVYVTLIGAMIAGRLAYALSLVGGIYLLNIEAPFLNVTAFYSGIIMGIPGMVLQLVIIPIIYMALKKGGLTFEQKSL